MSAALREFCMGVKESAFGTTQATPVSWTQSSTFGITHADAYYVRLDGGNAQTGRSRPVQVEVPYGGGFAVGAYRVSDKQEIRGVLTQKLSVAQAPFWLSWCGVRISGTGTAPWTTTEPDGDLPSITLYHGIQRFDGTVKRRKYLGCKVDAWNFSISEASTVGTLTINWTGSKAVGNQFDSSTDPDATEFPSPADNNFPIDPFLFIYSGGPSFVTVGGGVRTHFTELALASNNTLARRFYANRWLQVQRFEGRSTTLATRLLYETSPDDRTNYEGLATEAVSVELNDGTHGFTCDLQGTNVFDPFEDDLPLGDLYFQASTSKNLWDSTAGADLALTFA